MPRRMRFVLLLVLLAVPVAAAAQDRAAIVSEICSGDFRGQRDALQSLAAAGVEADREGALWARRIVDAFEGRALRCQDETAFIETDDGLVSATTLAPAEPEGTLSAPSVNLRLRAVAASAGYVLTLVTEDSAEARLAAARRLDRRREAVTADVLAAAAAQESDPAVSAAVDSIRASLLLGDPDPQKRIEAIEAIAADPTLRNRTTIAEALANEPDPEVVAAGEAALSRIDTTLAIGDTLSTLFSGLSYASVLLLAALGLAIIFGMMGVINLAQGELIMVGAYAAWFTQEAIRATLPGLIDVYLFLAIPVSFLTAALVGVAMEMTVIRRLYDRPLMTLLATWAISLLLINAVRVGIGTQNLEFHQPAYVTGGIPVIGDFIMTANRLFAIGVAVAAFVGVILLLRGTTLGMNMRAVTQNRAMAGAAGIDTRRTDRVAFGLGSGLAGLAGLALSPLYNVNPTMGTGFIVDSLAGAVVASLGIGQINVAIEPVYGAVAAKVIVLLLVILFIQRRPEGLFAPKGRR
jgi:urea transport system permease protein